MADAVKYRPLQSNLNIQASLSQPIFDWTAVAPKYFEMISRSVGARIPVVIDQFSVSMPGKVSEIYARYNIYGGASSITVFPDKLAFDFPLLLPNDIPLVRDLLRIVYDVFATEFSRSYGRVEINSGAHLELLPPGTVTQLLGQYGIESVEQIFGANNAVVEPAVRFSAKSADPPWTCSIMVEQSLLNAAAIFVWQQISLTDLATATTFEQKFKLVAHIGNLAQKAFNLEPVDVVGT